MLLQHLMDRHELWNTNKWNCNSKGDYEFYEIKREELEENFKET